MLTMIPIRPIINKNNIMSVQNLLCALYFLISSLSLVFCVSIIVLAKVISLSAFCMSFRTSFMKDDVFPDILHELTLVNCLLFKHIEFCAQILEPGIDLDIHFLPASEDLTFLSIHFSFFTSPVLSSSNGSSLASR